MKGWSVLTENDNRISLKLDRYKPLREIVFEGIRDAILNQRMKPGERVLENQLAEELGVSRTPVREALHKLEQEGLIYFLPRKGAFVSEISLHDIEELYEIRGCLEGLACVLAAKRATAEEFKEMEQCLIRENLYVDSQDVIATVTQDVNLHSIIYKAARNERLFNLLNNLREQIYRMRVVSTSLPGRKKRSLDMHRKLVEAISQRNGAKARELAQKHMEDVREAMIEHLKKHYAKE